MSEITETISVQSKEADQSANWSMYHASGVRVSFTRRSNEATGAFGEVINAEIEALKSAGFTTAEPGLEPGEHTQHVDGWVMGAKKDGEPCVFCYSQNLKYKVFTIWKEQFATLPFTCPKAVKKWDAAAPPDSEEAQSKGYWNAVSVDAVMRETGEMKDNGYPVVEFSHWAGQSSPEPQAATEQAAEKPQAESDTSEGYAGISFASDDVPF